MATVRFYYRARTKETCNLSIRVSHNGIEKNVRTHHISKKDFWIQKTTKDGKPIIRHRRLEELERLQTPGAREEKEKLTPIRENILEQINNHLNSGYPATREFFKTAVEKAMPSLSEKQYCTQIDTQKEKELKELEKRKEIEKANLMNDAMEKMLDKYSMNKDEKRKFNSSIKILERYQKCRKKIFKIKDLNQDFANDFNTWALTIQHYGEGYVKGILKRFRRACVYVYENDDDNIIKISKTLKSFKLINKDSKDKIVITLNFDELDIIENAILKPELEDARKSILIGCETALRYSDFNKLNENNIIKVKNIRCWQLQTQKTKAKVSIPISERLEYLINKFGLPKTNYPNNGVKLNEDIKEVCKQAGIIEKIEGDKITSIEIDGEEKKQKRTIRGVYPKHQLISTRTFRRSFATNYYGKLHTPLIMVVTGHTTEKMLRTYINAGDESNLKIIVQQVNDIHKERQRVLGLNNHKLKKVSGD